MTTLVSLRFRHDFLDLSGYTKLFVFPVARVWRKGEQRTTPKGDLLEGIYEDSYCCFSIPTLSGGIVAAIETIEKSIESLDQDNVAQLMGSNITKSLFCTIGDDGEEIPPHSLAVLSKYEIRLDLNGRTLDRETNVLPTSTLVS
jgi:hypothetical protein